MPTLGWVLEDSLERFLDGTTVVDEPRPMLPPVHPCPFCRERFATPRDLSEHLSHRHVGHRPFLQLAGTEPAREDRIRQAHHPDAIQLFDCTDLWLSRDGHRYRRGSETDLAAIFASPVGRFWLRLENRFDLAAAPISTEYDLLLRVPDAATLQQIDVSFVQILGGTSPKLEAVERFRAACPVGAADDYVAAMADYVVGVLLKDGDPASGIGAGPLDYRSKMSAALHVLGGHDRPLPRLLVAAARFAANDFSRWGELSGVARLDAALRQLGPLTGIADHRRVASCSGGASVSACPIDHGSDHVMRWAEQLAGTVRWGESLSERLRGEMALPLLDGLDRVKLAALWARRLLEMRKPREALEPLRLLLGDHNFGKWAEQQLELYDRD